MLIGMTLISFILSQAVPADPVTANLGEQAAANPGFAVFTNAGCGGCHTFTPAKSNGTTGPSLNDVTQDFTAAKAAGKTKATDLAGFIRESIINPNAYVAKGFAPGIMPQSFGSSLSKKQLDDLVGYLAKGGGG